MTYFLEIGNDGPAIRSTNYWESDLERAGKFYCSCNAGAVRLLIPRSMISVIDEWRTAEYVILSSGPWPEMKAKDAVELLFEDHSDAPFSLHFTSESFDLLPQQPESDQGWRFSAWIWERSAPRNALELPILWRGVKQIPDLSPWEK